MNYSRGRCVYPGCPGVESAWPNPKSLTRAQAEDKIPCAALLTEESPAGLHHGAAPSMHRVCITRMREEYVALYPNVKEDWLPPLARCPTCFMLEVEVPAAPGTPNAFPRCDAGGSGDECAGPFLPGSYKLPPDCPAWVATEPLPRLTCAVRGCTNTLHPHCAAAMWTRSLGDGEEATLMDVLRVVGNQVCLEPSPHVKFAPARPLRLVSVAADPDAKFGVYKGRYTRAKGTHGKPLTGVPIPTEDWKGAFEDWGGVHIQGGQGPLADTDVRAGMALALGAQSVGGAPVPRRLVVHAVGPYTAASRTIYAAICYQEPVGEAVLLTGDHIFFLPVAWLVPAASTDEPLVPPNLNLAIAEWARSKPRCPQRSRGLGRAGDPKKSPAKDTDKTRKRRRVEPKLQRDVLDLSKSPASEEESDDYLVQGRAKTKKGRANSHPQADRKRAPVPEPTQSEGDDREPARAATTVRVKLNKHATDVRAANKKVREMELKIAALEGAQAGATAAAEVQRTEPCRCGEVLDAVRHALQVLLPGEAAAVKKVRAPHARPRGRDGDLTHHASRSRARS